MFQLIILVAFLKQNISSTIYSKIWYKYVLELCSLVIKKPSAYFDIYLQFITVVKQFYELGGSSFCKKA